MSFLVKDELKTVSTKEVVDLITNYNDAIVVDIIDESIDVVASYLNDYFDTAAIFQKEGSERSKVVLKHLKSIVIHAIYNRRQRQMNETNLHNYEEAIAWLTNVSKGLIKPDLPPKKVDTDGDGIPDSEVPFMKLKSRKSYKNHW